MAASSTHAVWVHQVGTATLCDIQSSSATLGSYDFVAEALFGELDVDGFCLEYDDEWAGRFESLRFVPGKWSCWAGHDQAGPAGEPGRPKPRIDEAARLLPLDQLCLSGSASSSPWPRAKR